MSSLLIKLPSPFALDHTQSLPGKIGMICEKGFHVSLRERFTVCPVLMLLVRKGVGKVNDTKDFFGRCVDLFSGLVKIELV